MLVVVGALWTFFAVADEVQEGETQSFDERALLLFRDVDPSRLVGPPFFADAMRDLTALGGGVVVLLITALAAGFLAVARKRHALVFVLVAVGGGALLSVALKHVFARPRPQVVPHLAQVTTTSFPSGHSTLSAVVYLTLAALLAGLVERRREKIYLVATALLLMVVVGVSRVVLGVHYPTDVLAGWLVGLGWALTCRAAMRVLQRRGAVEPPGPETSAPA